MWAGPQGIVTVSGYSVSMDLGQSWQRLLPTSTSALPRWIEPSPAIQRDGTLLVGIPNGGIWSFGAAVQAAAGSLNCPVPLAAGLGDIGAKYHEGWSIAGCPTAPPTDVTVSAKRGRVQGLNVEDLWTGPTGGFRLYDSVGGQTTWTSLDQAADASFPTDPDLVVDGVVQTLENGSLVALRDTNGAFTRVVFVESTTRGRYVSYDVKP
jgi:hypothetical protein